MHVEYYSAHVLHGCIYDDITNVRSRPEVLSMSICKYPHRVSNEESRRDELCENKYNQQPSAPSLHVYSVRPHDWPMVAPTLQPTHPAIIEGRITETHNIARPMLHFSSSRRNITRRSGGIRIPREERQEPPEGG
jgi:hypothetical protein